ncbi:MAG: hypothetical protein JEZ14_15775 [Marinilabiliaceae bacterium]|nr:hypothetical protein [Marinilabiliaceae bacterium]
MSAEKSKLTYEKLLKQVHSMGPLDNTTINLVRVTTSLLRDDLSKFESLLVVSLNDGVSPSQLYHALFSLVDVVGLPKVMQGASMIEKKVVSK